MQKYCKPCSDIVARAKAKICNDRYRAYSPKYRAREKNLVISGKVKENGKKVFCKMKAKGSLENDADRQDNKWDQYAEQYGLKWLRKIEVPFSKFMSKNSIWSYGSKQGHVFIRKEVSQNRQEIAFLVSNELRNAPIVYGKLWLGIYVQKPTFKGDAINVVDSIADAIKTTIPIDDNLYSLMFVDWDVVFKNPKVVLYIGQKDDIEHFSCSYCGKLKPKEKYRSQRLCVDCSPIMRVKKDKHV